jgi:gas vesicle protein
MSNNSTESFFKGLIIGALGGAIAGILLAPKSGEETREDIKKLALEMKDKAVDTYNKARLEVEKKIEQVKKAGEKIDEGKYKRIVAEVVDEFKRDAKVTSSAAKQLGEQLSGDWEMVKREVTK